MNRQALESEVLNRMIGLTTDQKKDVMQYISKVSKQSNHSRERYRKKAIRQIKMALQKS